MRMIHRAGLLTSFTIPTFVELFSTVQNVSAYGTSADTTNIRTFARAANMKDGQTWYAIYTVGSCSEISRLDMQAETMTKTTLATRAPANHVRYTTSLGEDLNSLVTDDEVWACNMTMLRFMYPPQIIDYMWQNCRYVTGTYYNSSTPTNDNADLRLVKQTYTDADGVYFTAFRDWPEGGTSRTAWAVVKASTPLTIVKGSMSGGWLTHSLLRQYTDNGVQYLVPTTDEVNTATVRNYTLKRFVETW